MRHRGRAPRMQAILILITHHLKFNRPRTGLFTFPLLHPHLPQPSRWHVILPVISPKSPKLESSCLLSFSHISHPTQWLSFGAPSLKHSECSASHPSLPSPCRPVGSHGLTLLSGAARPPHHPDRLRNQLPGELCFHRSRANMVVSDHSQVKAKS